MMDSLSTKRLASILFLASLWITISQGSAGPQKGLAAQLDPSLTPQKGPKPKLPKIDKNACLFEGCQFGKWTALDHVAIYSTWESSRKQIGSVAKGEEVTAITGIHITFEPSVLRVTAPMPQYKLKPGDTVYGYMNLGEGFFSAWFNGSWVAEFDGSGVKGEDGSGCTRNCTSKLLKSGRVEWWVQIKKKDGTVGWIKDEDKFGGKDALARLDLLVHLYRHTGAMCRSPLRLLPK